MNNNTENKLVPKLRFPEFQNEEGWEVKGVGEVFEVTRGSVLSMNLTKENRSIEYPYPVYSSQTKNNGLAGYYENYLYEDAITWTTDGANAGDVNFRSGKFYCTNVCGVLINKDGNANPCIAAILNSVSKKYVSYVGNPKLMNGVMSQIKIPFPKIKEQQKIAACLSSLDEVITAESQKLELLKEHKKGLLQNLFPQEGETVPKLRFSEFKEDEVWNEKRLGEIGEFIGGGTPDTTIQEYWDGDIQWFTPTEIKERNIKKSLRTITQKGLQNSSAKLLPKGTLLITTRATIGDVGIATEECTTNQGFQSLIVNDTENNIFWYYWMAQHKNELKRQSSGSTFPEIGKNEIIKITAYSPKKPEQQKIADCLSSIDDLINAQIQKIEALKMHKKGLLQGLFPDVDSSNLRSLETDQN